MIYSNKTPCVDVALFFFCIVSIVTPMKTGCVSAVCPINIKPSVACEFVIRVLARPLGDGFAPIG